MRVLATLVAFWLVSCGNDPMNPGSNNNTDENSSALPPININITNNNENDITVQIESTDESDNLTITTTVTQSDNETDVNSNCVINGDNISDNKSCPDNLTTQLKLWMNYSH